MTSSKVKNLLKPALLTLCAVAFSLTAFHSTNAKARTKTASNSATTVRNAGPTAVNARKARRLIRIINSKAKANPKLAKSLTAVWECAVASEGSDALGSGFRRCLASWGISYGSIVTCAAVCVAASTGNPIGIGVCAACLGVSEWIVAGCLMKSVWSVIDLPEDPLISRSQTRGLRQAKLSIKRAPARS